VLLEGILDDEAIIVEGNEDQLFPHHAAAARAGAAEPNAGASPNAGAAQVAGAGTARVAGAAPIAGVNLCANHLLSPNQPSVFVIADDDKDLVQAAQHVRTMTQIGMVRASCACCSALVPMEELMTAAIQPNVSLSSNQLFELANCATGPLPRGQEAVLCLSEITLNGAVSTLLCQPCCKGKATISFLKASSAISNQDESTGQFLTELEIDAPPRMGLNDTKWDPTVGEEYLWQIMSLLSVIITQPPNVWTTGASAVPKSSGDQSMLLGDPLAILLIVIEQLQLPHDKRPAQMTFLLQLKTPEELAEEAEKSVDGTPPVLPLLLVPPSAALLAPSKTFVQKFTVSLQDMLKAIVMYCGPNSQHQQVLLLWFQGQEGYMERFQALYEVAVALFDSGTVTAELLNSNLSPSITVKVNDNVYATQFSLLQYLVYAFPFKFAGVDPLEVGRKWHTFGGFVSDLKLAAFFTNHTLTEQFYQLPFLPFVMANIIHGQALFAALYSRVPRSLLSSLNVFELQKEVKQKIIWIKSEKSKNEQPECLQINEFHKAIQMVQANATALHPNHLRKRFKQTLMSLSKHYSLSVFTTLVPRFTDGYMQNGAILSIQNLIISWKAIHSAYYSNNQNGSVKVIGPSTCRMGVSELCVNGAIHSHDMEAYPLSTNPLQDIYNVKQLVLKSNLPIFNANEQS
jgi:hypothetical protein